MIFVALDVEVRDTVSKSARKKPEDAGVMDQEIHSRFHSGKDYQNN
jgi:hypothetical protein